jgi:hypothetical protein
VGLELPPASTVPRDDFTARRHSERLARDSGMGAADRWGLTDGGSN